jgi:anti-anti-sigma factor
MQLDIVRITRLKEDAINYQNLVFMFRAADVFDLDGSSDMMVACNAFIDGGARKILIDMEGLDFIDSSGIGAIVSIAKRIRSMKGDIALIRIPPRIDQIFKPVNLLRFVSAFGSLDEAINFFRFA